MDAPQKVAAAIPHSQLTKLALELRPLILSWRKVSAAEALIAALLANGWVN